MNRLRPALLLSLLAALALAVAACGGSDEGGGEEASADTDVNKLLTQTFTGSKKVESGNLDLKLQIEAKGGDASQLQGPVRIALAGPFQAQGGGKLPKFKLDASLEGAGQSIKAGATSTGEKGYLSFQGTDYAVDDQVFQQFKAGYEEAQKKGSEQNQSFASLGMDPRKWLTDPKNEGEAKVGDDDTIKITGGVDVAKLLDDVNTALEKASSLGLDSTGEVPQKLTDEQRRQVLDAVKDPRVEIYTGKDDQILRRMVVNLGIEDSASSTSGTVAFDISITDLNEDQDIAEPADAKPFRELLGQFGSLGIGGAGSSGSGSGGADDGGAGADDSGGAAAGGDIEAYSKCVTDAGDDLAKVRECSELLAAP
jgi:hypothetical protein